MIFGTIVVVLAFIIYKIVEKKQYIKDVSNFIEKVNATLGNFIEEPDEKKMLGKAELFKKMAIRKKYMFDEAVYLITFAQNLPNVIYKNNLECLEKSMCYHLDMYNEMVGNGKKFIISPDIKLYTNQFLEEGEKFASKSERYISDSDVIGKYMKVYSDPSKYLLNLNEIYMTEEKNACNQMFNNIDGKSLDINQRNAVVNDDLRQLVIAGAGSGKTLTVAAKVKYLVERKKINPKEILLISFTRKSADEMRERIRKLGIDIDSSTFHKYGLDVIRNANKKTPDVAEDISKYIDEYLKRVVFNDNKLAKGFLILLGTLMLPVFDENKKIGERIEAEQRQDLTTIKGMYEAYSNKIKSDNLGQEIENLEHKLRPLHEKLSNMSAKEVENEKYIEIQETVGLLEQELYRLKLQKRSIRNEKMKSAEEVMLANIFFLDGIDYEYESKYPFDEADNYRKIYHPDFYLKESDVYWEHFGIDEKERAHQYSDVAEKKYLEGIKWKRELHQANGTKLAETYSWQFRKNTIVEAINSNYTKFGIKKHEVGYCDIIREILKGDAVDNIESFKTLLSTFISLFKSYGYSIEDFNEFRKKITLYKDKELTEEALERRKSRDLMFLNFAEKFYVFYSEALIEKEEIDFNDMIIQAAELINQGAYIPHYKYMIIDEYQDISVGRYKLAKATLEKSKAKLFCVGDDWQSIYRFTGSEVDLLINFGYYFGLHSRNNIVQTYRNSQELLDISGAFIMENDYQTPKQLRSNTHLNNPIRFAWYTGSYHPILENEASEIEITMAQAFRSAVKNIVDEFPNGEILLLGRNNSDLSYLSDDKGIRVKQEAGETKVFLDIYPEVKMRFLTVHRSKGLEADNVIILNARNSKSGFPNQIVDDPILNLLRDAEETYPFAEERRLFYVALTRTRNYTYILAPITQSSRFLDDIKMLKKNEGKSRITDIYPERTGDRDDMVIDPKKTKPLSCPICKVGTLVKRQDAKGKIFVSCSNFPACNYKASNLDAVRSNHRCPVCDNFLIKRNGINGEFMGCMSYPYCTYTANIVVKEFSFEPVERQEQSERILKYDNRVAYNVASDKPTNSHAGWTVQEDYQLVQEFKVGKTISEMAKIHQRSNGGISARLKKLGLID